jgi:hypothetical protein
MRRPSVVYLRHSKISSDSETEHEAEGHWVYWPVANQKGELQPGSQHSSSSLGYRKKEKAKSK